jgi:hemerythrin superfamily protein
LKTIAKKSNQYAAKKRRFKALCQDLLRHETMEHKVWYPNFKNNKKIKSEVKHLLSEEKHAEMAIKKFKTIKTPKEWDTHFAKFKKAVENHAREEEKKLFPNVRKILDKLELMEIGKQMQRFKAKYKKKKI